jgi:hypothetical protein
MLNMHFIECVQITITLHIILSLLLQQHVCNTVLSDTDAPPTPEFPHSF